MKQFRGRRIDWERHPEEHQWVEGFLFKTPLTAENFDGGHLGDGVERWCISDSDGVAYAVESDTIVVVENNDSQAGVSFIYPVKARMELQRSYGARYDSVAMECSPDASIDEFVDQFVVALRWYGFQEQTIFEAMAEAAEEGLETDVELA